MPCHVDTIVKIDQIRQTYKDKTKLTTYTTSTYLIESEDYELEMVLFIPINDEERDPNTQSAFEKNEFYCVSRKIMTVTFLTHLMIKRDLGSSKCPLKASFVGIMQDTPTKIDNENAMINVKEILKQQQIIQNQKNEFVTNLVAENLNTARHTTVEDKKDDYTEDNDVYEKCIEQNNNETINKNDEYKEITDNNKKPKRNYEKPNKDKEK
ncbi:1292_t:CDS:2 [Dentiscutata erythropus]|uniref:1292_t:CDS:1 n=1 Tax=Dentiscutata erythropus TaxID=1348616 RepID=A0A9N9EWV4_9GLOM|nr:1292_t:CDS:2 [Dentiscutata erythropus]